MTSSKSSPKHRGKSSFKECTAFDLFYQLTYMSAAATANLTREKVFEIAAQTSSPVAQYFQAVKTLTDEFRYDYPEACRKVGEQAKSEDVRSFLLRLADALRSGEPLAAFLAREAQVQSDNYSNAYERDLESLKKWSDAFSSIVVSVALIVIINMVSTMIYKMSDALMAGLVATSILMGLFGVWIISRAAPRDHTTVPSADGSAEQRLSLKLIKIMGSAALAVSGVLALLGVDPAWVLIVASVLLIPPGLAGLISDRKTNKKELEISPFLRSIGGMAGSTGTTLKEALTRIELSSFPTLQPDIKRLSVRLTALINPELCWRRFGVESGSLLTSQACNIFYDAVNLGGDAERVGFLCSLFASKTAMLRVKRRATAATFTSLAIVMHLTVAGLMVFVLEIVHNFVQRIAAAVTPDAAAQARNSLPMLAFSSSDLQFLEIMTITMVVLLALINAMAILASDGGFKLKIPFFLSILLMLSGASLLIVPSLVAALMPSG